MAVLPILGTDPNKPMQPNPGGLFGSAPPPLAGGLDSMRLNSSSAPPPLGFVNDKTSPAPIQSAEKATPFQRNAAAGYYGMQAAGNVQPTPSAGEAAVGVLGSTAQGAAMGASVGGVPGAVIGGGVGLVMGGLNAYMGVKSARKARDREEALRNDAVRMEKEEIARDEKWRVQNRLDTLEEARYQRKKYSMQKAYEAAQAQGKNLMALINANADLKQKYAKFGFV
jgi:hypothetical protein